MVICILEKEKDMMKMVANILTSIAFLSSSSNTISMHEMRMICSWMKMMKRKKKKTMAVCAG